MQELNNQSLLHFYINKHNLAFLLSEIPQNEIHLYTFSKREVIFSTGDVVDQMYFFVDGKVKIYVTTSEDRRLILRFQKALVLLGELEYIHNDCASNTVEACSDCHAIGISFETIRRHLDGNPFFLQFLLESISEKFRTKLHVSTMNLLYPVDVRFASYLLSIIGDDEESLFDEDREDVTLSDISEMIGTSYRHLNRVVQRLCDQEIIRKEKRVIHIKDRQKLLEIAKGNIYEQ